MGKRGKQHSPKLVFRCPIHPEERLKRLYYPGPSPRTGATIDIRTDWLYCRVCDIPVRIKVVVTEKGRDIVVK